MFDMRSSARSFATSAALLLLGSQTLHAGDGLINLGRIVEDAFHVAQIEPHDINTARGYFGHQDPPVDRDFQSNVWSPAFAYKPDMGLSCDDFSLKSWNDWRSQGLKDGEIIAFGYWNTPVHFVSQRGRESIAGIIAFDNRISAEDVVVQGQFSNRIQQRLLALRGGYHETLLSWMSKKQISIEFVEDCDRIAIYKLSIE